MTLACVTLAAPMIQAVITAEAAAKLKTTLTPVGGERANNKEGTIPLWESGHPVDSLYNFGSIQDLFAMRLTF